MRRRLILVPQVPIRMRYQEWWIEELLENLADSFNDIVILGSSDPHGCVPSDPRGPLQGAFSSHEASIENELVQIDQFMKMHLLPTDVLFHCDLSFPGIFHSVLFHKRPARSIVFCHASAKNRYDIFQPSRVPKWRMERTFAQLYDKVLVATDYHKRKLNLPNVESLGSLPNTPARLQPDRRDGPRTQMFCSTARETVQRIDRELERAVTSRTGEKIHRHRFLNWDGYFRFLDRTHFLLITTKEETYGMGAFDALQRGCIPIAPRAYSYPELLPDELLYDPSLPPDKKAEQIEDIAYAMEGKKVKSLNRKAIPEFYSRLAKVLKGD